MPPSVRFSREAVLNAAYQLVRRDGPGALNARSVARELGGSTQPIFRLFSNMDELRSAVIELALQTWKDSLATRIKTSSFPYLTIGMAYLVFSRDEPQLFKLLFMRDRVSEGSIGREYKHDWGFPVIEASFGVDRETAVKLYERTFFYTHGIAVCFATKYMPCMSEDRMETLVTENLHAAAAQLGIKLPEA